MKQQLKFIQEYEPSNSEFSPFPMGLKLPDGHTIGQRWVEISFNYPEDSRGYVYMTVSLFQIERWQEEAGGFLEFKDKRTRLIHDDFYAWNNNDDRLSVSDQHLITALASGNFLGKHAESAVHALLLAIMKIDKQKWAQFLPGEIAFREHLDKRAN